MTYDQIKELIDAFRAETQADSISPDILGQLIQKILDYASAEGIITQGLEALTEARDDALAQITSAEETAAGDIETAKQDALDAIGQAKSDIDLFYEII